MLDSEIMSPGGQSTKDAASDARTRDAGRSVPQTRPLEDPLVAKTIAEYAFALSFAHC